VKNVRKPQVAWGDFLTHTVYSLSVCINSNRYYLALSNQGDSCKINLSIPWHLHSQLSSVKVGDTQDTLLTELYNYFHRYHVNKYLNAV